MLYHALVVGLSPVGPNEPCAQRMTTDRDVARGGVATPKRAGPSKPPPLLSRGDRGMLDSVAGQEAINRPSNGVCDMRSKDIITRTGRRPARTAIQRSPLPASLPRPAKLARDRSPAVPPPAHIRVIGGRLEDGDRDAIARKLGRRLGKFASSIERVTVRLSDANGPKGGRDQIVRIKVVLSARPSVVVEERDAAFPRAVDRATNAAAVAVRRSLQRRRLKPLHHRAARPQIAAVS